MVKNFFHKIEKIDYEYQSCLLKIGLMFDQLYFELLDQGQERLDLSFDLFPVAWKGYALIHIPLVGNLHWIPFDGDLAPVIFSFTWLFANMTYCWHLIAKLGLNRMLWVICVSTTIAFFLIEAQSERTFWGPLIIFSAGILGTFRPDITPSVFMSARTFFKREKQNELLFSGLVNRNWGYMS